MIEIILFLLAGCGIGYAIATRHSLGGIERVNRWIDDTESDQWVSYKLYKDLQEKYENTLKEYEQYRGMVKCLKDLKNGGVE